MSTVARDIAIQETDVAPDQLNTSRRYNAWMTRRVPSGADLYRERRAVTQLRARPLVSIVMPIYNTPPEMLSRMLSCITQQTYPHWELCVVDDGSAEPWIARHLSRLASSDRRVRFHRSEHNGGIAAATNRGVAMATGEYVTFVDHDDELDLRLLFTVVRYLNANPSSDVVHYDLDYMLPNGQRLNPLFVPAWSPELLLALPYILHVVVRRSCLAAAGELRSECDGGQDYDLMLRLADVTSEIHHIPELLYHWRIWPRSASSGAGAKPYAFEARKQAIRDTIKRRGLAARCVDHSYGDLHRVLFDLLDNPLVSIIVAVNSSLPASVDEIAGRLQRLARRSAYRRFEIIVCGQPTLAADVVARLAVPGGVPVRAVACDANDLGTAVNRAAAVAAGDHLLLLDARMDAVDEQWLSSLLEYSQQPAIGAVGAQIFAPGGTVRHAGVQIPRGVPVALKRDIVLHASTAAAVLNIANLSAVSAECLMTRRDVFEAAGGFRTNAQVGFADVDYCLRVRQGGRRIVFTPFARLRAAAAPPMFPHEGNDAFRAHWGGYVDPYFNPNLSPDGWCLPTED